MTLTENQSIDTTLETPLETPKAAKSLFSKMNLADPVMKAVIACGYLNPTPIQEQAIPHVMEGNDVVACAQTGTGKTAAFILPALHKLSLQQKANKPRVLVLTPTRELATQITKAAAQYGKFMRFNMASLVGGMSYRQQLKELSRPVDLIVATPGRLLDHLENRRLDLSGIEMLVLDEADRMLDMGFIDDVQAIAKATPDSRQTLLFSATIEGKLTQVVKKLLKKPIQIDLSQNNISADQIKQELYYVDSPQHKARLLQHFLANGNIFKAIIFSATKLGADRLAGQLSQQGYLAAALHGDLKQSMRNRTLDSLRRGKIQFLVATDVAARGIDIADMTHVINYDLPRFCEDYVHRIGRTGRAGKSGIALSFALPSDKKHVFQIEHYIGMRLDALTIPGLEPVYKPSAKSDSKSSKSDKKSRGAPAKKGFKKKWDDSRPSKAGARGRPSREEGSSSSRGASQSRDSQPREKSSRDGQSRDRYARDSQPRESGSRDGQSRDRYARDSQPRESSSRDGQSRDRYSRDAQPRERSPRDGQAKDRYARDSQPREKSARDGQSRDRFPRDSQPRERSSRDGQARERFSRDSQPREKSSRDGQARERFSRDSQPRESSSRDGQSRDSQSRDRYSRDSQSRERSSREGQSRDGQSRDRYSRDSQPRERSSRDGQAPRRYSSASQPRENSSRDGQSPRRYSSDSLPREKSSRDGQSREKFARESQPRESQSRDGLSEDKKIKISYKAPGRKIISNKSSFSKGKVPSKSRRSLPKD